MRESIIKQLDFLTLPGKSKSERVDDQLREPHDLQSGPYQGTGRHVVDEEGPVVWQEDTLPVDLRVRTLTLQNIFHQSPDSGQTNGRQDQNHEQKVTKYLR